MKRIYILTLLTLGALPAAAQYNPTIEVEGKYKPDVIIQDRVNMFPERLKMTPTDSRLSYDTEGVVTDFTPFGVPMEATGWKATRNACRYKGYVGLDLGSWLDARLRAGYRFVSTQRTWAGIYLDHKSTSLWRPDIKSATRGDNSNPRREAYDETLGLYLRHEAPGAGTLFGNIRYNLAYFNYFGYAGRDNTPTQTINDGLLNVLWQSERSKRFRYHAGADIRLITTRRGYAPGCNAVWNGPMEITATPEFGFSYGRHDASSVGLDLSGDFVTYSGQNHLLKGNYAIDTPDTYGRFSVTPYYSYRHGSLELMAGPRIDMVFNAGRAFNIAPDVRVNWGGRGIALSLQATGGTKLNTLGYMRDRTLYCQPYILNTDPTYSPLDAELRVGFGPFAGFKGEVFAGYRITRDRRTGGWYPSALNAGSSTASAAPYENNLGYNTSGYSVGMTLGYNYGRYIDLTVSGSWQPQDGKLSYWNGWDLPEVLLNARASTNPWRSLRLELEYDLRACRRPALLAKSSDGVKINNIPMANHADLNFKASYDILPNLNVRLGMYNLLNRHQELLPGLPQPGLTVTGGVTLQF